MKHNPSPIHGWLILDKPEAMSSAHAVAKVKRLLRPSRIGHAGTLDPLATGILPLALGEATKTVQYVMDARKSYTFTVRFGIATETDDREGAVMQESTVRPTEAALLATLPAFTGTILQTPPAYSAIKIDGERAYALARAGEAVEMQPRPVDVERLSLVSYDGESATLAVDCGKGTYVRALARDLARALGTCGHVSTLRRTRVGKFDESRAISLETLEQVVHSAALDTVLVSIPSALDGIPALEVAPDTARMLKQGQNAPLPSPVRLGDLRLVLSEGMPVALAQSVGAAMKPVRCFVFES